MGGCAPAGRMAAGTVVLAILAVLMPATDARAGAGEWTSNGPTGASITALAIDQQSPAVLYAGTADSGVFKSANDGASWAPLAGLPFDSPVSALAVDPTTSATVFAGFAAGAQGNLFKSADGGGTWTRADAGLASGVLALAIDPRTPATLYAGTGTGVFRSLDGGAAWAPASDGLPGGSVASVVIDPETPATLYAVAANTRLFKSTDAAASWTELSWNSGLPSPFSLFAIIVAIDPQTPTTVYLAYRGRFGGSSSQFTGNLLKSVDAGATWSPTGASPGFVLALAIDPQTPTTLYAGVPTGALRTVDGGGTWGPINTGFPATVGMPSVPSGTTVSSVTLLAIGPRAGTAVYASITPGGGSPSQAEGLFKSLDGGNSWNPSHAGINVPIRAVAVDPRAPATLYAGGRASGVFKSTGGGASWGRSITIFGVTSLAIHPLTAGTLYAGTSSGVFRSVDGSATFTKVSDGLPGSAVLSLAIDRFTPGILYAGTGGHGVFKSLDEGSQWSPANSGIPNATVTALVIDPLTPTTVYAGTRSGVFKTEDGGQSWNARNSGLTDLSVNALAVDAGTPATLYAATIAGGVFKSVDGGLTWSAQNSGLPTLEVTALAAHPVTPGVLYSGTRGRVFGSVNGAGTWSALGGGFGSAAVSSLALTPSGSCIHAGTDAGVLDLASAGELDCPPATSLVAAVLPASRSVQVGTPASAFATVINAGTSAARSVVISSVLNGQFVYQTTDPLTNTPSGAPNAPVDIAPGESQTYVIALTRTASLAPTDVAYTFRASNADPAPTHAGINTLLLSVSTDPAPDIVALAATVAGDGIARIAPESRLGAFAVAAVNVGAGGLITAIADTGSARLPLVLTLCQTDPASARCLSDPAPSVTLRIEAAETPTFSVFMLADGAIPFDAVRNRVFVRFKDDANTTRGTTSVAVVAP